MNFTFRPARPRSPGRRLRRAAGMRCTRRCTRCRPPCPRSSAAGRAVDARATPPRWGVRGALRPAQRGTRHAGGARRYRLGAAAHARGAVGAAAAALAPRRWRTWAVPTVAWHQPAKSAGGRVRAEMGAARLARARRHGQQQQLHTGSSSSCTPAHGLGRSGAGGLESPEGPAPARPARFVISAHGQWVL